MLTTRPILFSAYSPLSIPPHPALAQMLKGVIRSYLMDHFSDEAGHFNRNIVRASAQERAKLDIFLRQVAQSVAREEDTFTGHNPVFECSSIPQYVNRTTPAVVDDNCKWERMTKYGVGVARLVLIQPNIGRN